MFRNTIISRRILGIGTPEHLRHREPKNERWMDKLKSSLLCIGIVSVTSVSYSVYRYMKSYVDPKATSTALNTQIDGMMLRKPDLAVALLKMMIHYEMSAAETPFASPMVAPSTLKTQVEELEDIVRDLVNYTSLSVPDVWDMLCIKAVLSLGGPALVPLYGRQESLDALKVHFNDSFVNDKERNIVKIKKALTYRGWGNYDIVALVGLYRSCGYHGGIEVSYDKDNNKFYSKDPLKECRKTKLYPFVFGGEYFDGLITYDWQPVADHANRKSVFSLFSLFENKPAVTDFYRCFEDKKAVSKALIVEQTKKAPTVEMDPKKDPNYTAPKETVICHGVTMEGIDMSLLDDPLLAGLVYKYSYDENEFFNSTSEILRKIRLRGHNISDLTQRME